MLLTSKFLDSKVAVVPSYTFVEFIIRQQGHQLRKHRFSHVHKLVYEQFSGNSNRKNLFSLSKPVFIGHYEDWKKVNGTLLFSPISYKSRKIKFIIIKRIDTGPISSMHRVCFCLQNFTEWINQHTHQKEQPFGYQKYPIEFIYLNGRDDKIVKCNFVTVEIRKINKNCYDWKAVLIIKL